MDNATAAKAWIDAWSRGWAARNAELVAERYTAGARVRTLPFREPEPILEYARRNFEAEDELEFMFGEPVVGSDHRAAVEYWASWRENGEDVTIAGASLLRFNAEGLVEEHWDYWVASSGRISVPEGWGR